jgi:hypothetical protein
MRDAVHEILEVRAGMAVTRPRRFPLAAAMSDAGWYLIVADGWNHRFVQPSVLTRLSSHADVVTCTVDERNLAAAASGWSRGERQWSVSYAGEDDPGNVIVDGTPPEPFAAVRDALTEKSGADDAGDLLLDPLFEIPIELARQIVGYRPDEPSPAFDGRFVLLETTAPTLKQRLFGG